MRKIIVSAATGLAILGLSACDVEQTEDGDMPDVTVEGGNLPEYDVDTPDVDVTTEETTIDVPVVDIEPADAGAPGEG